MRAEAREFEDFTFKEGKLGGDGKQERANRFTTVG